MTNTGLSALRRFNLTSKKFRTPNPTPRWKNRSKTFYAGLRTF